MLGRVLDDDGRKLVAESRQLLGDLRVVMARLDADSEDQETLEASVRGLDGLFLLVTVGEFNAGKSAFINALLGQRTLEEGVTPTTSRITLLTHGEQVSRQRQDDGVELVTAPVELLREVNIVDTPGTNAVLREHEALTREFVPRSDLVLFITSADRPFTESERSFLEAVRSWGKKVVVVLNKIDILEGSEDVSRVLSFVEEQAKALLGLEPRIFPVSARQALRAKTSAAADGSLEASGFPPLERYVTSTLDEGERLRLKLLNPIGVGRHLLEKNAELTAKRLGLLAEDLTAIEEIDHQLALYREDLGRDFRFRLADVENVLLDFEKRGNDFFDETLRLGRVFDLVNRSRIEAAFERQVVADLPTVVERRVDEIVDWMVASDLRQWQGVTERLAKRQAEHAERMLGRVNGPFESGRARLLETVKREAQRAVESYDRETESRRLASGVRDAVAGTALLQIGALGLGAAVTALATTTMADVTGILAAGALSVVGLLVIPARRKAARRQLRTKVAQMRQELMGALTAEFDREVEASVGRVRDGISPYTRFVRSEKERLSATRDALDDLRARLDRLATAVEGYGNG
jgi:small GTP-binding protein